MRGWAGKVGPNDEEVVLYPVDRRSAVRALRLGGAGYCFGPVITMGLVKKNLEQQGCKLEVIATAQHKGQEPEPEQCQGEEGKVGKHRKFKERAGNLVNI